MAKYTEELVEKIVLLIEEDTYSISEICNMLNISRKSFYEWKNAKPEFKEALKNATKNRDDKMLSIARKSLRKKLEGYTLTEIRTTYIPDEKNPEKLIIKTRVVRQREHAPDSLAIKHVIVRNDTRETNEDGILLQPDGFNIIVRNEETAQQIRILEQSMRNSNQKSNGIEKERENSIKQKSAPTISSTKENMNTDERKAVQPTKSKITIIKGSVLSFAPPGKWRKEG